MAHQLHMVLLPHLAYGHFIPILDMAKLFISRGLKTTIIATHAFVEPIDRARQEGYQINVVTVQFPPEGSSLPNYITSSDKVITAPDLLPSFIKALSMLQQPVESLLQELRPDCLISDAFFPWTAHQAAKLGFPRLAFHGFSCFALYASFQMNEHKPFKNTDTFDVPNLPHRITFTRTQVSPFELQEPKHVFAQFHQEMRDSLGRSYGIVFNSFYELEPDYIECYRNSLGSRTWHIGPLLLSDERGKDSEIDKHECLAWLDSKKPNSVMYVCFGSMATFTPAQLHEMAIGIEGSGQDFIWVLRKQKEEWMPEGFEERTKGRGLIIRGWAPQMMILGHGSIGGFVTHCGWNSILEGICSGLPMVTWPVFAEQFFNEKFVIDVLKIGVSVGNKNWRSVGSEGVGSEAVMEAIKRVMVGEEGRQIRKRVEDYREMGRKAIEQGGSSYNALTDLIHQLSAH